MRYALLVLLFHIVNSAILRSSYLKEKSVLKRSIDLHADSVPMQSNSDRGTFSYIRHRESKIMKTDRFLDSPYDMPLDYCSRPAKCEPLNYTTCLGAKLPYKSTTLNLTDLETQEKVQEQLLLLYQYLRYVPKCWAIIQPFLCALYMPNCSNDLVNLPSREMCEITVEHCKIFLNTTVFPEILNCNNDMLFPSKCKNDVHLMKFNTTGYCMDPLIKTDKQDWYYPGIEGCGLKCKDSLYTETEHHQIHKLIGYCAFICILCTLFTTITFLIDWNAANKYPALAIFYINVCFFISYMGWFIQFLSPETRDDIVCKRDGTLRKSEPSASENLSCVMVFVMVYYFAMAGMVWFVIFSYSWHMTSLQALGKSQERIHKKRAYFHLVAWSLPLILTITTMAVGEIDSDYVTGICFVGFISKTARIGLLLAPSTAALVIGGYIIIRGLILLIKVRNESQEVISEHSNKWKDSLSVFILCKLTSFSSDYSNCKQENRPSVAMLQLQLLAAFGVGISMASWVWCEATMHAWERYIRKKFHWEVEVPVKHQKHKVIANAFAKRKKYYEGGKISIEDQNHTDPVGLDFDPNSASSNELSTSWVENLRKLIYRRGAVPNQPDSEMSLSLRHVSIESRCNSGDSQLSVQIAELKAVKKVRNGSSYRKSKRHARKSRSRHSRRSRRHSSNHDSHTSLDSHLELINALTNTDSCKSFRPNLNRRTANAGLDGQHLTDLLNNGKLRPYSRRTKSGSEDENVSVTISESKINMVLSNTNNLDLNDHLMIQSLRQQIGDISTSMSEEEFLCKDYGQEKQYSIDKRNSHVSDISKQIKYSSNTENSGSQSESSSCPEIKNLVQSSLNSAVSGGEKLNRSSRQSRTSRTSTDVAVQTSIQDIEMDELSRDEEERCKFQKTKVLKTKENKKYKKEKEGRYKGTKDYCKNCGTPEECEPLRDSNKLLEDEKDCLKEKKKHSKKV
ncbi:hypothetical protein HHI36_015298 [Cryptolaemus montrouzieri]|uniref:Smoothened n=1 Tax=Cryptolaemus montrouzieri TaxID=559131 RepID=A0ABD2N5E5_9CUCU